MAPDVCAAEDDGDSALAVPEAVEAGLENTYEVGVPGVVSPLLDGAVELPYVGVAGVSVLEGVPVSGAEDASSAGVDGIGAAEVVHCGLLLESGAELKAGTVDFVALYVKLVPYESVSEVLAPAPDELGPVP